MVDSEAPRSEVLMVVVFESEAQEAKEAMATKKTWKRNDDRGSEVVRLRGLCQQDARNGNEQIWAVGR